MQKSKLNQQMSIAMSKFLERVQSSVDIPIKIIGEFVSPQNRKLLSNASADVNSLELGVYLGYVTDTEIGVGTTDTKGFIEISVVNNADPSDGVKIVSRKWNNLYSQTKFGSNEDVPKWAKVLTTEALEAKELATTNPNKIQPIPIEPDHSLMKSGLTHFIATAGELGIPVEVVSDSALIALASVFVLTTPTRSYLYEARIGNSVYVSTIDTTVNIAHNWKAAGGTDQTAVEELIRGLIATAIQAVDKTNNTSLLSPMAFSVAFDAALAEWIGAAPEALDTLQEIAAAFQNNPDIINVMMGMINDLRTETDLLTLDVVSVKAATSQLTININNLNTTVTELGDQVDGVSTSLTSLTDRVVVLESADSGSGGTASGFSIKYLNLDAIGQNLFNNVDIKAIEPGFYAVELVEAHLANFDGALSNISVLPLLATVNVADDDLNLGERIVYWTVSDGINTIRRMYSTLTSTGVNVTLISDTQLALSTDAIYLDLENSINRVGYKVGDVVTTFSGKIVKGGPISTGSLESRIKVQFTPAGEILAVSPNPLIQVKLNELANYWLPYGAVASDYSFKYELVGGADLDSLNTTMSLVYAPMGGAPFSVAVKGADGTTVSSTLTVYIKHNPTGAEKMIPFTLQANANYFN